ncbi:MAG: caspase family protein [Thioploca sp.]|nr:caspase family protein [Thioploca sp.]
MNILHQQRKSNLFHPVWRLYYSVWSLITLLLLSLLPLPAATATNHLNNLLVELYNNMNDEAFDEAWDDYENWEKECLQAKQPQKVAQLLLEFENNVVWEAVLPQWEHRRDAWVTAGESATTFNQVAKLLLELEANINSDAIDEEWQENRQKWIKQVKKWLVIPTTNPPIITWLYPTAAINYVTAKRVTIKACLQTSGPLVENAQIYVNNALQKGNLVRQLEVVTSGCDVSLKQMVQLREGQNQIKIVARNSAGKTAEKRSIHLQPPIYSSVSEKRTALVIGNSDYARAPLRNPTNDANAMANKLRRLAFEVMSYTNLGQNQMKQVINKFSDKIAAAKGGVGLFYFAGHGVQVKGENYLIPIDANIRKENEVELEAVSLARVLASMENAHNRMNIVIIDACRDSPYERSFRSQGTQGLASPTAAYGTVVAFATAPGSVTADGDSNNGIYTEELLQVMDTPGLKLEEVFKQVLAKVRNRTHGAQVPWYNAAFEGDFYFNP